MEAVPHAGRRPAAMAVAVAVLVGACAATGPTQAPRTPTPAPDRSGRPDPTAFAQAATFGAWRRSPIRPTPDFAADVGDACRAEDAVGDAPLAVLDARGEGRALLVFDAGDAATLCVADAKQDGSVTVETSAIDGSDDASPPPERTLGRHDMHLVDTGGGSYGVLVGQVGGGVHDVAANFDADLAWYTAAMDNGWYALWWPGADTPLSVAASNQRTEVIDSFAP